MVDASYDVVVPRLTLEERLWPRIKKTKTCWIWTGATCRGHGVIYANGKQQRVHRVVYELLVGPIPVGAQLDHVRERGCLRRDCCNPAHLEPVSPGENLRRSPFTVNGVNARKTHCVHGHEFTPDNTVIYQSERRPGRQCRTCKRERSKRSQRLRRRKAALASRKPR